MPWAIGTYLDSTAPMEESIQVGEGTGGIHFPWCPLGDLCCLVPHHLCNARWLVCVTPYPMSVSDPSCRPCSYLTQNRTPLMFQRLEPSPNQEGGPGVNGLPELPQEPVNSLWVAPWLLFLCKSCFFISFIISRSYFILKQNEFLKDYLLH